MGKAVHFGYGLTETSSGVALSLGSDPYAMTVCPDDAIDIAPDGEVLISAPTCVMEWEKLKPVMTQLPRGQQLRGIELYGGPLPRTASGKIMRWAVQREGKEEK